MKRSEDEEWLPPGTKRKQLRAAQVPVPIDKSKFFNIAEKSIYEIHETQCECEAWLKGKMSECKFVGGKDAMKKHKEETGHYRRPIKCHAQGCCYMEYMGDWSAFYDHCKQKHDSKSKWLCNKGKCRGVLFASALERQQHEFWVHKVGSFECIFCKWCTNQPHYKKTFVAPTRYEVLRHYTIEHASFCPVCEKSLLNSKNKHGHLRACCRVKTFRCNYKMKIEDLDDEFPDCKEYKTVKCNHGTTRSKHSLLSHMKSHEPWANKEKWKELLEKHAKPIKLKLTHVRDNFCTRRRSYKAEKIESLFDESDIE